MTDTPPPDTANHAEDFARRWVDRLDQYCALRMQELGIPERLLGTREITRG